MPSKNNFSNLDPLDPNYAVNVVELLLPRAIERGASDIHLQPNGDGWDVWYRIDGVLSVNERIAGGGASDPVTRLMVLAGLPTYRSSQPMEGRIHWSGSGTADLSMRLGIFPSLHGPRAVVRLLRGDLERQSIDSLGLTASVAVQLGELCRCTDGAVLLCGPSGSGKTTTLYAMLRFIAGQIPRRNVLTIEDPIESVIDSVSQSELDPSAGMTLASALRSAVRQDSEVLLVSEIRDPETAEAAMQASLTGHLVFSSLHATDIASALRRLTQLGVPAFVIRSGIRAIVSLRLLRKRCPECRDDGIHQGQADQTSQTNGQTCEQCLGARYHGRLAVGQCVRFDGGDPAGEAMADAVELGASVAVIQAAGRQHGGTDLRTQAMEYVRRGITDEAEVYRVLGKA